jgi:hypothetical protein
MLFDRRMQERYIFSDMVEIEYVLDPFTDYEIFKGFIVNTSESGLCLLTSNKLKKGEEITIKSMINAPSQAAVVQWIEKYDNDYYKVGLVFESMVNKIEEFEHKTLDKSGQSKDTQEDIQYSTKDISNIFRMLIDLDIQIKEQRSKIDKLETESGRLVENIKFLVRELVKSGYIKIGERRKNLKRNIITQEALVALLSKKRIMTRKELVHEIKKRMEKASKANK